MNEEILKVNPKLAELAERIPAKGMHLGYLEKVCEVMDLYGELLSIMDNERTPENETKAEEIAKEIQRIIN